MDHEEEVLKLGPWLRKAKKADKSVSDVIDKRRVGRREHSIGKAFTKSCIYLSCNKECMPKLPNSSLITER